MKSGSPFPGLRAAERRRLSKWLRAIIALVRGASAGSDAGAARHRRPAVDRVRPMQFIGVIPADVMQEKAR
jgi:hypothetical protein